MNRIFVSALTCLLLIAGFGCGGDNKSSSGSGNGNGSGSATVTAPSAPTNVTATAGNAQVVLNWTAVSNATTYNVYVGTATGVTAANGTANKGVTGTTYTATSLTNGTAYYFIVTAVNTAGESAASAEVHATPVLPAPAAPTGLTATAGSGQVSLSWTASAGAANYNVYYATAAGVTTSNSTKVGNISGTSTTVTGLTGGTAYYFVVTAQNAGGESPVSNEVSATPTSGASAQLTPGTATKATFQANATTSLVFSFDANAVSQPATVNLAPVSQSALPVPLSRKTHANARVVPHVNSGDTFIAAFTIGLNPASITAFNDPVGVSGTVSTSLAASSTINLAVLNSSNVWVDVATFVIGANGAIQENLASVSLPGLIPTGNYLLYQPAQGSNTSVSNFGIVMLADDGGIMADKSNGLQVIHLYDANGSLLTTPTIAYLDYANSSDLDGQALTPDGSQGIMVDGGNTLRFFSGAQTGTPVASTTTLDVSAYGGDGDSVAIMPNGDEAVVSADSPSEELLVSGIVSGSPVAASTIPIPSNRDGLVISNDGTVMLARGFYGLTVYSIAATAATPGSIGGTVTHTFTQQADLPALGSGGDFEDGRQGMAISPTDPSRAVIIGPGSAVQLLTGLPSAATAGTAVALPNGVLPYSVSISPDGKLAVIGTSSGLLLFSGVDTGTLTQVGSGLYAPSYTVGTANYTLAYVSTLGITLDGKYVVAGDYYNRAIIVVPFTASGFAAAPAAALDNVAIPANDQLLIH